MFTRCLAAAVAVAALVAPAFAADPATLPDGKYVLAVPSVSPAQEQRLALLDLKTDDGKPTATVTDGGPSKAKVGGWRQTDGLVTADVATATTRYRFEGRLDAKNKRVLGTLTNDTRTILVVVAPTELEELTPKTGIGELAVPDAIKELNELRAEPRKFQLDARKEKDADKRKELLDQAKAAKVKADAEAPKLLRSVVEAAGTDTTVLYFAGNDLLGVAGAAKAKPDEVKGWAAKALAAATAHGPKAEANQVATLADTLAFQDGYGEIALGYAEKVVAANDKEPAAKRVRGLKALAAAQTQTGKADAAKATRGTLDKLETELDAEYTKAGPGFTPTKYAGRKDKDANRVAVFELFTGAMCPPCTPADLAFDGLETAYSPKDLILLQYHQHIPLPDPLTNPDTLARWKYYTDKFPEKMLGAPSSVFGGTPKAGGGGVGRADAQRKFDEYRKVIDELLEQKADATVGGTATLTDGVVTVNAAVTGKTDGATVRIVLAEEEVRYLGGNGVRMHHQVVRGMFGKPEGWPVKELKDGKATASVKLAEVKKSLAEYVDKYHKEEKAFSNPDRPFKLEHLKVVVLVQDDASGEILAAVQLDVAGK